MLGVGKKIILKALNEPHIDGKLLQFFKVEKLITTVIIRKYPPIFLRDFSS